MKATPSLESVTASLPRPTLAVVDYAAARLPWLRDWLDDLASSPPAGGKLRILLLERYADPKGGWWAEAFQSGGWGDTAVQRKLDPADGPYVLSPLAPVEDRRNILEEVFSKAGSDLRLPEEGRGFDRDLAKLEWGGEPLFLLMAGLIAAREGFAHVLTLNRSDLAFEVARRHELNRIGRIGESRLQHSRSLVCHMAAYATLCQGLTRDQAEEAIEVEARALRYVRVGDPPEIYKILHAVLPRAGADVAPILPDIVGEAAILLALGDGDPGKARESVARAAAIAPERITAVVIRMAQDFGGVDGRPAEWLDCLAERVGDTQALLRLVNQLPEKTLVLREVAARLTAAVVERLRVEGDKEELAGFINNLSIRLNALGRSEEALHLAQEAVDANRELPQDTSRPHLALSLITLSNRLSGFGRHKEALEAVQESVAILRELAQSRPDAFLPDLGKSLINLSSCLGDLRRYKEALEAVQAAVDVCRELSQSSPGVFRLQLAASLSNLALWLRLLDHHKEALKAVQEAVDVYRELSQSHPDAFRPDLGKSLTILSGILSDLGRREEALEVAAEAVDVFRDLSQTGLEEFRLSLAFSLYNLACCLQEFGDFGKALQFSEEAVRMHLHFFLARPATLQEGMAKMTSLYLRLSEQNDRQPDSELIEAIDSTFQKIQPPESP
ncbi:MAG TPA: tetratricopeptide repeat protein [Thermoanaerobaculia bacterium]|nr:tetratricopeptide repeat protein [Thermoanaerobaculia bacterium]